MAPAISGPTTRCLSAGFPSEVAGTRERRAVCGTTGGHQVCRRRGFRFLLRFCRIESPDVISIVLPHRIASPSMLCGQQSSGATTPTSRSTASAGVAPPNATCGSPSNHALQWPCSSWTMMRSWFIPQRTRIKSTGARERLAGCRPSGCRGVGETLRFRKASKTSAPTAIRCFDF